MTPTVHDLLTVTALSEHRTRAAGQAVSGGDFVVVVPLPDGRIGVGVGEVDGMATAAYAVVDPASGTLVHASAGHLPPACLTRDGAWLIEGPVGLPLGVGAGFGAAADGVAAAYEEEVVAVPAGSTVLAYTDGEVRWSRCQDLT